MSDQNFEEMYNKLKEDFENNKQENEEICKEYESTIQLLSESAEDFKKQKEELEQKIKSYENEKNSMKKEKETLINKNKDKMVDIQNLNKQNDRLSLEVKRLQEEKALFDSKIVSLENDNEHFQNKLRENEAVIEDLENQLENALEENITLQTEFEVYKQTSGDQLIRKDEELHEMKNEILIKEKLIQKLSKKGSLLKNIQNNLKENKDSNPLKRRFTIMPGMGGVDISKFRRPSNIQTNLIPDISENKNNNKGFNSPFGSLQKLNNAKNALDKKMTFDPHSPTGMAKLKEKTENKYAYPKANLNQRQSKNTEIEEISEVSESNNKFFNDLYVCDEKRMEIISSGNNENGFSLAGNEKIILDKLQNLLNRVQRRKVNLLSKKKGNKQVKTKLN